MSDIYDDEEYENEEEFHNSRSTHRILISALSGEQLKVIMDLAEKKRYKAGEAVIKEGQAADSMFFLLRGKLNVDKSLEEDQSTVGSVDPGDWFGEIGILDNQVRSASVIAKEDSDVLVLKRSKFDGLKDTHPETYNLFIKTIASSLCTRMRKASKHLFKQNAELKEASQMRLVMGTYICFAVLILSGYSVLLKLGQSLIDNATTSSMITSPFMILLAATMYALMKRSGYPLSSYGLSMENAWKNTIEAAVWTIPVLLIITALKWLGIVFIDSWADQPLFIFDIILSGNLVPGRHTPLWQAGLMGATYLMTVPVQEFIVRGAFQTPLARFLTGPYAVSLAILIANTLFTTVHLHMSPQFAVAAFFPGLFWGWLYARQGTLLGPCVSHGIIGVWALYAVGIRYLLF